MTLKTTADPFLRLKISRIEAGTVTCALVGRQFLAISMISIWAPTFLLSYNSTCPVICQGTRWKNARRVCFSQAIGDISQAPEAFDLKEESRFEGQSDTRTRFYSRPGENRLNYEMEKSILTPKYGVECFGATRFQAGRATAGCLHHRPRPCCLRRYLRRGRKRGTGRRLITPLFEPFVQGG